MPLFQSKQNVLLPLKELNIDLEKDVQSMTEVNLNTIFGLKFVTSEFALHNFRIDTLAFNEESSSFVIIEYKRDRSLSIIDQGYAYLALLLNNKAEFILEINEKLGKSFKKDDIDWSQSKIIFVANSFTPHQRGAINFKDLPFELWEAQKFENNTFLFNQLKPAETSESIRSVAKDPTIAAVSKEVKIYTLEGHLQTRGVTERIKKFFPVVQEKIFSLDSKIEMKVNLHYVAFTINGRNFAEVIFRVDYLQFYLDIRYSDLKDPKKIAKDRSKVGHHATGNVRVEVRKEEEFDYAMFLIQQSYRKFQG